jgi:hypothetical protein
MKTLFKWDLRRGPFTLGVRHTDSHTKIVREDRQDEPFFDIVVIEAFPVAIRVTATELIVERWDRADDV